MLFESSEARCLRYGTAIAATQKLYSRWIGIDITELSIALQKYHLEAIFSGLTFQVVGSQKIYMLHTVWQ